MLYPTGREEIVNHFKNLLDTKRLSHAYLLCGQALCGKKTLCNYIVHLIMCEQHRACGACNGCLTVSSGANPDVKVINNGDKASIGVDKIRELIKDVYIKPIMGEKKVFVIENAHLLTQGAQNALLKVMEEPPSYAVFFLICDNINTILQTIMSRVSRINLPPLKEEILKKIVPGATPFLYHYCQGNIGELIKLKDDEGLAQLRQNATDALLSLTDSDAFSMYEVISPLTKDRKITFEIMELMLMLVRDVILQKNGLSSMMVNEDKINEIKAFSNMVGKKEAFLIAEIISSSQRMLGKSGNITMAVETMFIKCREVIHG